MLVIRFQQSVPSTRSIEIEDAKESYSLIWFKPEIKKLEDCILKLLK